MNKTEWSYCDHCGIPLVWEKYYIESLPCDIESANKGESACLCRKCYHQVKNGDGWYLPE